MFFFNDTATTEIYTLSLHDALPIWVMMNIGSKIWNAPMNEMTQTKNSVGDSIGTVTCQKRRHGRAPSMTAASCRDRKSTRLNSSHANISYAVFCLKKKKYS